ncbi:J domain-containing protein [Psychroserpens sp. MEBiC05023]
MQLHNYYQLLHVDQSADLDTIKKAFRTEIALYHPDNNKSEGARTRFEMLVEGFEILSNQKKRDAYDKMLGNAKSNTPVIIKPKAEEQYKEWKKESRKKSKDYWNTSLTDLLLLDIFLEAGFSGLFTGAGDFLGDIGDSLGDVGDIFDIF